MCRLEAYTLFPCNVMHRLASLMDGVVIINSASVETRNEVVYVRCVFSQSLFRVNLRRLDWALFGNISSPSYSSCDGLASI